MSRGGASRRCGATWTASLVHVAYLLAFALGGYAIARITYRRRLYR